MTLAGRNGTTQRTHELKCWPPYFEAVRCGVKTFEIRKDDRGGFAPGQRLTLREWDPATSRYSGRICDVEITYVLLARREGFGLRPGYAALGITVTGWNEVDCDTLRVPSSVRH